MMTKSPPSLNASSEEWHYLHELADLCREITAAFDAHSHRTRWTMQDGSPFQRERDALSRQPSPTNGPWTHGDLAPAPGSAFAYLSVAKTHLDALALLLENGAIMFSLGPLVRSIVEHCARVAWALDPRCSLRERLARAFWVRLDDLNQARRLAKAGDSQKDIKIYTDLLNDLRRSTLPEKFYPSELEYHPTNHDLRRIRQQNFPGFSELVSYLSDIEPASAWDPRAMYDFLSAQTHPTMHIYRLRTRDSQAAAAETDSLNIVRVSMKDLREPRDLTYLATFCFVRMWRLIATYYGIEEADDETARAMKSIFRVQDNCPNL